MRSRSGMPCTEVNDAVTSFMLGEIAGTALALIGVWLGWLCYGWLRDHPTGASSAAKPTSYADFYPEIREEKALDYKAGWEAAESFYKNYVAPDTLAGSEMGEAMLQAGRRAMGLE